MSHDENGPAGPFFLGVPVARTASSSGDVPIPSGAALAASACACIHFVIACGGPALRGLIESRD